MKYVMAAAAVFALAMVSAPANAQLRTGPCTSATSNGGIQVRGMQCVQYNVGSPHANYGRPNPPRYVTGFPGNGGYRAPIAVPGSRMVNGNIHMPGNCYREGNRMVCYNRVPVRWAQPRPQIANEGVMIRPRTFVRTVPIFVGGARHHDESMTIVRERGGQYRDERYGDEDDAQQEQPEERSTGGAQPTGEPYEAPAVVTEENGIRYTGKSCRRADGATGREGFGPDGHTLGCWKY